MKRGLKLWSINTDFYLKEAVKLYENGIFDYIELYVVPESLETLSAWKKLNIPFIIHNSHFAQGFNLAKSEKAKRNREIYEQTKRFADELNAKYIIFHGGIDGDIEETAKQLASFKEPRAVIENKPYVALPNRMGGEFCRGYNFDEIKTVMEVSNCGFCFDFGHAICAANSMYDMNYPSHNPRPLRERVGEARERGYLEQTLKFAKQLRQNSTDTENILWHVLRNKQLYGLKFRRQQPIGKYIADFVCLDKKIIIELDGSGHLTESQNNHDSERDKFLFDSGFKVIRVYNNDVFSNLEGVVDHILNNIEGVYPSPQPSPSGGEGAVNYPPLEGVSESLISGKGLSRHEFIYSYLETFLPMNPNMFHLTDINDITSPYDSHPHLGTGQLDFKRIFDMIPYDSYITFETVKNSKENLNDFVEDMKWLRNFQ